MTRRKGEWMNGRMARVAKVGVPAVAGLAMALLGGVAGPVASGQDADSQPVDRSFAYTCALPEGSAAVTVRATATFPKETVAGEPVEATGATLSASVPPAALAGLPGAATATAVVRWDNAILYGDTVDTATWATASPAPVPLSATENAVFEGPADVPSVAVGAAGDLELAAAALTVTVTGYTAEGVVTEPPTTELSCLLDEGQNAGVVVVSVAVAQTPSRGQELPGSPEKKPDISVGPGSRSAAPGVAGEIPKECHKFDGAPPNFNNWFCANLAGYANVNKLNASVLQPAGTQNITASPFRFVCPDGPRTLCFDARILPDYQGEPKLPPAPGSFRAFGFVPTTGTMQLTQLAPAESYSWSTQRPPYRGLTTIKVKLSVRILEVAVNGVPLAVGPGCQSAVPIEATLYGVYPAYSITLGGPLTGKITVPPFDGCGATEDLDPIVSGLVSGPDNFVKMTQGPVCYFGNGSGVCPPPIPVPQR